MATKKLLPIAALIVFLIFVSNLAITVMTQFTREKEKLFEILEGSRLVGHVIQTLTTDEFACGLQCLRNNRCRSYNSRSEGNHGNTTCELSDQTRQSSVDNLRRSPRFTYHGKAIQGRHPSHPAHSCKDIRDSGDSKGDGEYWIDPEKNGKPLKVYCDMTTDSGGWLLVSNVLIDSSPPSQLSVETSYRGLSNYHNNIMVLHIDAMNQLRTHLSFTQLRFHCSKQQGRTFHVTTAANSTGEAVVQYFSGQTNVMPDACGSFARLKGDNSYLAAGCSKWGKENNFFEVGKWGHQGLRQLYQFPAFIAYTSHWVTNPAWSRWECDDFFSADTNIGDWKIFVR